MTAREAEAYIDRLKSRGSRPGLERVRRLAEALGQPQDAVPCVHIAGTNGKGSVLAYVSTVLKCAGYRVGRFFSPAMDTDRETVQCGGRPISIKDWCVLLERILKAEESFPEEERPTFFEALTVLAFLYFKEIACDIAVVECGMGGAGDATNIITAPLVSVFTPISLDHTAVLGADIKAIAAEKSGIIKAGARVVSARQQPEAERVLSAAAKRCGTKIQLPTEPLKLKISLSGCRMDLGARKALRTGLTGSCQPQNAALALTVLDELAECAFPCTETVIRKGLEETVWYGRFSVLGKKPVLVADGAHNPEGAERLAESIKLCFPGEAVVLLMGVLKDKDYEKMLGQLLPLATQLVCVTAPGTERALPAQQLADCALKLETACGITAADSVEEGLELALLLSGKKLPVVACGSLSWLGRLRKIMEKKEKEKENGRRKKD